MAPDAKAMARDQIAQAVAAGGFGRREVLIRVNALDSPWWIDDVAMAGKARPDGILVPKVSSVRGSRARSPTGSATSRRDASIRVWAMIETARAVLHAEELAAASRDSGMRLAGFVFGSERYFARDPDPHAAGPRGDAAADHALHSRRPAPTASKSSTGPTAISAISTALRQECAQARDLGFDGKTLIHPGQIEACNAIFTPPAEEVAQARKIIAAFERPENASRGAIQLDGQMVERLHAEMARRTIAIADAIAAMGTIATLHWRARGFAAEGELTARIVQADQEQRGQRDDDRQGNVNRRPPCPVTPLAPVPSFTAVPARRSWVR